MDLIKFRQPIYESGKVVEWHIWGFRDGLYNFTINQHRSYLSTGKNDKNGIEIFEGDILQLTNKDGKLIKVTCEFGTKERELRNFVGDINSCQITGFYFLVKNRYPTYPIIKNYLGKNDLEIMEVVGNILIK